MLEIKELYSLLQVYGIGIALLIIIIIIISLLTWKFLIRKTELIAEDASSKSLKIFQSQIDKDFFRFQIKHQKQIDSIHETYQKFQKIVSVINYITKGENFTQQISPQEELKYLVKYRHEFKEIYLQNHLLFTDQLCSKIDSMIFSVDSFIKTYDDGLLPSQMEIELDKNQNKCEVIAGIFPYDQLTEILQKLDIIGKDIEKEFKKIYGIN